jgi:hypothetical protein
MKGVDSSVIAVNKTDSHGELLPSQIYAQAEDRVPADPTGVAKVCARLGDALGVKMKFLRYLGVTVLTGVLATTLAVAGFGSHAASAAASNASGSAANGASGCSISPGQVSLDQVWTVSASRLPVKSTVEMIINFPNGAQSTGPITVGASGTFSTTGNSNMSASWGFITPEQVGTYTYQFVSKVKWPAGTFNTLYAQCSVLVS